MKIVAGGKDTVGDMQRVVQSIPASYTVWKDGTQAIAECNLKGGTDYTTGTDAVVIQNALDGLTAGRTSQDAVYLKGPFTIATALIPQSHTHIILDGSVTLADAGHEHVLKVIAAGQHDITIEGGKWIGATATQAVGAPYASAIAINNCNSLKILNAEMSNAKYFGATLYNCQNVQLDNLYFSGCGADGIILQDCYAVNVNNILGMNLGSAWETAASTVWTDSDKVNINNVYAYNVDIGVHIEAFSASRHDITASNITAIDSDLYGVYLHQEGAFVLNRATVNNVVATTPGYYGIGVVSSALYRLHDLTINDVVINGAGADFATGRGLLMVNISDAHLSNFEIADTSLVTHTGRAVDLDNVQYSTFAGFTVRNTDGEAFYLEGGETGCLYNVLSNLIVYDNQGAPTTTYGYREVELSDYNVVSCCKFGNATVANISEGANSEVHSTFNGLAWVA
jgi:hypothetical protein